MNGEPVYIGLLDIAVLDSTQTRSSANELVSSQLSASSTQSEVFKTQWGHPFLSYYQNLFVCTQGSVFEP